MRKRSILPLATLLAAATIPITAFASDQPGANADQWKEEKTSTDLRPDNVTTSNGTTDAGQRINNANMTRGAGPLNFITGVLSGGPLNNGAIFFDADVFCITITNPAGFSATTGGSADTCLALFDSAGHGIAFNDNRTDSATSLGSRLTNLLTGSLTPGTYYLAISLNSGAATARRLTRPLNGTGGLLFPGPAQGSPDDAGGPNDTARRQEVGPISAAALFADWEVQPSNTGLPFASNYAGSTSLLLTGASFSQLPAPGAAGLLGLGGLIALRRRR